MELYLHSPSTRFVVELQFLHTLSSIWSALYCIFVFADEDFASSFLASCKFFFLSTENVQLTD